MSYAAFQLHSRLASVAGSVGLCKCKQESILSTWAPPTKPCQTWQRSCLQMILRLHRQVRPTAVLDSAASTFLHIARQCLAPQEALPGRQVTAALCPRQLGPLCSRSRLASTVSSSCFRPIWNCCQTSQSLTLLWPCQRLGKTAAERLPPRQTLMSSHASRPATKPETQTAGRSRSAACSAAVCIWWHGNLSL